MTYCTIEEAFGNIVNYRPKKRDVNKHKNRFNSNKFEPFENFNPDQLEYSEKDNRIIPEDSNVYSFDSDELDEQEEQEQEQEQEQESEVEQPVKNNKKKKKNKNKNNSQMSELNDKINYLINNINNKDVSNNTSNI
jgi:hypothetical protein